MSKKKFALWAFLSIFLFVFVAAGCSGGGGGDGSGGGGSSGGSGEYSFNDLEGTWSLVPGTGHGTASGNYAGYPISGTAECQMLEIAIANIRVNSDATLADAAFAMSTYWTFTAETPYGSFSGYDFEGEFSSGADDVEDPPKLRKTGSNAFVYEYSVNEGDMYNSTITITLTSSTTANVRQTFDYTGGELAGTVDKAEMTYSLRKTSGGSLDNSGGTEDVVEGQGTKLEDVYD
ncbi:MAG: hypothetical protein LBF92_10790, partial [Synergistaceae bacterium]|nr:hypothetical protein [Synergistaceae bacterium]